jgi:hypothetical protein
MSTLKAVNFQHPSAVDPAIELESDGSIGGFLGTALDSKLPIAGGKVLQVVSATKTDTFSTSSTSYVDITGMSLSITPSYTTSKILLLTTMTFGGSTGDTSRFQFVRNSTAVGIGDAAGSRVRASSGQRSHAENRVGPAVMSFVDAPSTTSAITYKIQASIEAGTLQINRSNQDVDGASFIRSISTLLAIEVSA